MKKLLFFFLLSTSTFAQVFRIDSLPKQGILLDKGWKWHAGDNAEWAKANFDDAAWEGIDPTKDIFDLPKKPKSGEIGWLRIQLSFDSTVFQHGLALIIQQSVASDYYLNGKLIHSFGKISSNSIEIEAFDPLWKPVSFQINKEKNQVLAIRFVLQPNIRYTKIFETANPIANVQILKVESAVNIFTDIRALTERFTMTQLGAWVMLFMINLVFFISNRSNKMRLYFTVYALIWLIGVVVQLNYYILDNNVANKFYVGNLSFIFYIFAEIFLMMAMYEVLGRKRDWVFWLIVGYVIPSILLDAFVYGFGWQMGGPMLEIFVHLNITRIAIIAIINKKRNALFIAVGGVASLLFFILFLRMGTFYNNYFLLALTNLRSAYYFLFTFSIPIAANIYLGLEFAFMNKTLKQKLDENEKLAEEKQHILANQNETLEKKVEERTAELNKSLTELKATQNQLVQKEKLASLGELTAGIAHEIQNPLNFVNNFSELSVELIEELSPLTPRGGIEEELFSDITQNLQKINHHGKRASNIVKGMLEHSRNSTGERVLTDINQLADEYLRLSYHGMRAKDKNFNCDFKTDFDENLPKINVIPQDIGRVLVNLINNAFYAVSTPQPPDRGLYSPKVTVSTNSLPIFGEGRGGVEIRVKDNGNGIPKENLEKIFQPFFTTKPTNEGTGLGLSLSYDIITKGHGGTLEVESVEGEGSTFTIKLKA